MLRSIGTTELKIASPELNHIPLLAEIASYRLPVYLSSGVSTLGDIEEALQILSDVPVTLLHCVTAYPAPPEDYNLLLLRAMATLLGVAVGVSDHTLDPVLVPVLAVTQGAAAIEKHITLSRRSDGLDDPVALEPADFARMVREVRSAEKDLKAGRAAELEAELEIAYGADRVRTVLGNGIKRLAPSEADNYGRTNRSIHAIRALSAGGCIGREDVAVLRTEKILTPGLHPRYLEQIIGTTLSRPVADGQGINWSDLVRNCRDVDAKTPP